MEAEQASEELVLVLAGSVVPEEQALEPLWLLILAQAALVLAARALAALEPE